MAKITNLEKFEESDELSMKVLYHGSPVQNISKFRKGRHGTIGSGIYFCDNVENTFFYAGKYGDERGMIYEANIRMFHPFIIEGGEGCDVLLKKLYGFESIFLNRIKRQASYSFIINSRDIRKLKKLGYDGIIWKHPAGNEYVVWDAWQIKVINKTRLLDYRSQI